MTQTYNYLVDSHCHLDYPELSGDLKATLARAQNAGVGHMLTIGVSLDNAARVQEIAALDSRIHATVGVHPHEAEKTLKEISIEDLKATLLGVASNPKVVGYGETGLDYYYNHSPKYEQRQAFQAHIEAALEQDMPLIVHTRNAEDETIELLRDVGQGKVRGVIHCFSGSQSLADRSLELGFYISISGIITFKKADELRDIVKSVPLDRLLVETDAPYLAPIPHRGQPNEPSYVVHTAQAVADIKGIPFEEVRNQTTANFYALFTRTGM